VVLGRAVPDGEEDPGRQADVDGLPDPAGQGKVMSAVAEYRQGLGGAGGALSETVIG
jgi:hypothetical protein